MTPEIDILIEDDRWSEALNDSKSQTEQIILYVLKNNPDTEISIVLTNDKTIQSLNNNYRGKDKATNVLSFPQNDERMLGDVIMAFETIQREATEQKKTFPNHYTHMLIHGTLHLLGFDHETQEEAEEMESLEISLLESLGIKNPYETK